MPTIRVSSLLMTVAAGLALAGAPVAVDPGRIGPGGADHPAAADGRILARPGADEPWRLGYFLEVSPRALARTPLDPTTGAAAATPGGDPGLEATPVPRAAPAGSTLTVMTVDPTLAAATKELSHSADRQLAALIVAALNGKLALGVPEVRESATLVAPPTGNGTKIAAETASPASGAPAKIKVR